MRELAGVDVDAKQVERTAEALGREISDDERRVVEPSPPTAPTMYLGMDGTGVPMRSSELAGRAGKQPDGSAKTREVKLCTVWTAEGRDDEGTPVRDHGLGQLLRGHRERRLARHRARRSREFAQRVDREARRRGFDQATGAWSSATVPLWIWKPRRGAVPRGRRDRRPVPRQGAPLRRRPRRSTARPATSPGSGPRSATAELDEGRLDDLLAALAAHATANEEARRCLDYVTANRERMRYPEFRAQGLCVSSGVVEAGCKVAVGTRLKRAGMRWTLAGADAIIALRCCQLSGRFEDFWERRSCRRAASAT